eukprot:TRINITY_DN133_c0_g1_i1.p1 TRINITY_DN133_c0_g1~~TRINITY_DN133_c0_g1_i1.p1  ORF type:complete len:151 (+),score=49.40 TRINITY_DN133_c0_g1_i1:34-453(+)
MSFDDSNSDNIDFKSHFNNEVKQKLSRFNFDLENWDNGMYTKVRSMKFIQDIDDSCKKYPYFSKEIVENTSIHSTQYRQSHRVYGDVEENEDEESGENPVDEPEEEDMGDGDYANNFFDDDDGLDGLESDFGGDDEPVL